MCKYLTRTELYQLCIGLYEDEDEEEDEICE